MNTSYVIFDGLRAGAVRLPKFPAVVEKMAGGGSSISF
jgi:hypothetical protein